MNTKTWDTKITKVEPNELIVCGYSLDQLIGQVSFTDMVYLLLKKELPSEKIKKVFEGILVSSVDHGPTPPSTLTARTVTSTGAPLNAALAAGILSINEYHGGAIENCMLLLLEAVKTMKEERLNVEETATQIIKKAKDKKQKLAGFGHRIHTDDPRTNKLYVLAEENEIVGDYVKMAQAIQRVFSREKGKAIPINVDGAIASLLCEMDFAPELANAIFSLSRLPGLTAHIYEEKTTQKPMRHIIPGTHNYTGPEKKNL